MFGKLPNQVKIVEVGPRDGLQNEKTIIETSDKIEYIKRLIKSGLKFIEVTSFVNPQKIPQMKDSSELFKSLKSLPESSGIEFISLVPNLKGLETALNLNVNHIALFTSTSNEFNKRNINATIDESLIRIEEVMNHIKGKKIKTRGYVSTVFGCPYEGKTSVKELKKILDKFFSLNVDEISLGDTTGIASPLQVEQILKELKPNFDLSKIALHFHDTYGMALANILVGVENGIKIFDASSGGLGGCPYAKGATGNVATEDVYNLFNSININTGINIDELMNASKFILEKVKKSSPSKFFQVKNRQGN